MGIEVQEEIRPQKIQPKVKSESPQKPKATKNWSEPEGQLAIDVYETNEDLVIQSTIAGIKAEDLDISIENDVVAIRGSRRRPTEDEEKKYFYQECFWGSFSRQVILPEEVDSSQVTATINEGVLTLRMPKIQRKKRKKITVKAGI